MLMLLAESLTLSSLSEAAGASSQPLHSYWGNHPLKWLPRILTADKISAGGRIIRREISNDLYQYLWCHEHHSPFNHG